MTDQVNRKIERLSDGLGRLVTVNEQDSSGNLTQTTNYSYDILNNLTQVNQGNQLRSFKYDAMGRLLYERIPEQSATINDGSGTYWSCKYTYTDFNAVSTRQDARGVITSYSYDTLHRPWQTSYNTSNAPGVAATDTVTTSYNTNGTISGTSVGTGYSDTYSYDSFQRLAAVTKFIAGNVLDTRKTYTFSFSYNGASQPLSLTYPSGTQVSISYDGYGRPGTVGSVSGISYNVAGQVTGDTLLNGVTEQFGYDPARLQMTSQKAGTTSPYTNRMDLSYGYNATGSGLFGVSTTAGNPGQLLTVSGTINSTTESAAYTYDNYGRLLTSNQTSNGSTAQRRFAYDRFGNRTAVYDSTSGGNQIQAVALQQSGGVPTNQISSVTNNGTTFGYTYDAAGNVTNDGQHSYTYDAENRIVSVDSGAALYRYDAQNHRVTKIVGTSWTHYVWQGNQVMAEHDGTTAYGNFGDPPYGLRSAKVDYLYAGSRLVTSYQWTHTTTCNKGVCTTSHTSTPQYYLSDRLSVRLVLDSSGNVVGRQAHLPFGEDFAESGTQQKQHFTSYERDSETGTDYAVNRQYNQSVGRFNRVDPIAGLLKYPQTLNRYTYVLNNPTNATDALGLDETPTYPIVILPGGCSTIFQYEDGFLSIARGLGGSPVKLCSYTLVSLVPIGGGGTGGGVGGPCDDVNQSLDHGKRWQKLEIKHDRPGTNRIGFCRDRDGMLWFWNKDELSSYDGQHWSPTLNITELLKAVAGHQPDRLLAHERRAGRPFDILDVISTRDGCLWLATLHGVVRFDPHKKEWQQYPDIGPYSTDYIYEDRAGRIWVGDTGGKKEVQVYDRIQGTTGSYALGEHILWPEQVEERSSLVHAIYQDRHGRMLFAVGRWLLSFSETSGEWEAFSAETIGMTYLDINGEMLPGGEIMNIMEDIQGRIWLTGRSGIAVLEQ